MTMVVFTMKFYVGCDAIIYIGTLCGNGELSCCSSLDDGVDLTTLVVAVLLGVDTDAGRLIGRKTVDH